MKKKFLYSTLFLIILTSCGFKVVKQNQRYFDVVEVVTKGDARINYYIKNKLYFNSGIADKQLIRIKLDSKKNKNIKERNIKNEITKYNINLLVNIELEIIGKTKSTRFVVTESGDYSVGNMNSITINNEKNLIKALSENINSKIVDEITIRLNDL